MGEEAVCLEMPMEEDMTEEISATKNELKRGHLCIEEDNIEEELHFNKRQAKEASNDDIRSEISNPVASPVDNASSFRDITSNPAKSSSGDRVGSDSGSDDTLSDEEHSEYVLSIADSSQSSDDVPSCFVREIPKHLSTTGITKITFKLNEDFCDLPMVKEQTWESAPWNVASSTLSEMVFTNFPSNVKKLLSTGILDDALVKYFSISHARELHGIIHSGGYLCGCTASDFSKVIGA